MEVAAALCWMFPKLFKLNETGPLSFDTDEATSLNRASELLLEPIVPSLEGKSGEVFEIQVVKLGCCCCLRGLEIQAVRLGCCCCC